MLQDVTHKTNYSLKMFCLLDTKGEYSKCGWLPQNANFVTNILNITLNANFT